MAIVAQQIIDAFDARMKTILTSNGYSTNVGQKVFAWRSAAMDESELDGLVYRDESAEIVNVTLAHTDWRLSITIHLYAAPGDNTMTELRKMIDDVCKAIGTDEFWGGLALRTDLLTVSKDMEHQEHKLGQGELSIAIIYRTARWGT